MSFNESDFGDIRKVSYYTREIKRKAVTRHYCAGCGKIIVPGQMEEEISGKNIIYNFYYTIFLCINCMDNGWC